MSKIVPRTSSFRHHQHFPSPTSPRFILVFFLVSASCFFFSGVAAERSRSSAFEINLDEYNDVSAIESFVDGIPQAAAASAAQKSGLGVRLTTLGTTFENRPIKMLTIYKNNNYHNETRRENGKRRGGESGRRLQQKNRRRSIFLDCGIHAREWIAASFCIFVIDHIMKSNGSKRERRNEFFATLPDLDLVYVVALLNPDGYAHSWTEGNRLWRKNRRPLTSGELGPKRIRLGANQNIKGCPGVDVNRNFGYMGNVSRTVCGELYSGPEAFSEAESRALRKGLAQAQRDSEVMAYFSAHCCTRDILAPFSDRGRTSPNLDNMLRVMKKGTEAIKGVSGRIYRFGSVTQLNRGSRAKGGTSMDWAHGTLGIPYAFTLEFEGAVGKRSRFLIPEMRIVELCRSVLAGLKAMIREIIDLEGGRAA